jgi:cysteine dioxygenase
MRQHDQAHELPIHHRSDDRGVRLDRLAPIHRARPRLAHVSLAHEHAQQQVDNPRPVPVPARPHLNSAPVPSRRLIHELRITIAAARSCSMMTRSEPPMTSATQSPVSQAFPKLAPLISYLDSLKGRADLKTLTDLLTRANITRQDILPACQFGVGGYKRNTIAESSWYELLALCWRSGHCTPIHDHSGVSCAFKVVEGTGTEIRFMPTPSGLICPTATTLMAPGYICAAADADIHQVANMQPPGVDLITLHMYSPPIAKMRTYKFATSEGAECASKYDC